MPNPYAATVGEILSPHLHRNRAGLLIQSYKVLPSGAIDSSALHEEISHLQDHVFIASFVGGHINRPTSRAWLQDLECRLFPHHILLHKEAGNGFWYVKVDSLVAVKKAIDLFLHNFPGGTAAYQY